MQTKKCWEEWMVSEKPYYFMGSGYSLGFEDLVGFCDSTCWNFWNHLGNGYATLWKPTDIILSCLSTICFETSMSIPSHNDEWASQFSHRPSPWIFRRFDEECTRELYEKDQYVALLHARELRSSTCSVLRNFLPRYCKKDNQIVGM